MKRLLPLTVALLCATLLCACGAKLESMTFPSESVQIYRGETASAVPTLAFSEELSEKALARATERLELVYASDDESVVTVDTSGTMTGIARGDANITVTDKDGTSATLPVAVRVAVEELTSPETVTVYMSKAADFALEVKPTPEDADVGTLLWESSDAAIVAVDDSGAKPVHAGECDVTVRTAGENGFSSTTHVTVIQDVEKIDLGYTDAVLFPGATVPLKAVTYPEDATEGTDVTWSTADNSIASVNTKGFVTALGVGETTVTATASNGVTKSCAVHVLTNEEFAKETGQTLPPTPSTSVDSSGDASTRAGRAGLAQARAAEIVAQIAPPGMSDYDKAAAIFNWMVANVATQNDQSTASYAVNHGDEAYSAFFMGISACSGQCHAVTMMSNAAGLQSKHVNQDLWAHQWNLVLIDGVWTVLDPQGHIFGGETHPMQDVLQTIT